MDHPTSHDFRPGLRKAIKIMGTQRALAEACGVKQGSISATLIKKDKLASWLAVRIVKATAGKVSMRELLPDVVECVEAELVQNGHMR